MTEYTFDLFDPEQSQHMWPLMHELRAKCPVSRPMPGIAYTARYEDTQAVFRNAKAFPSVGGFRAQGTVVDEDELLLGEMDAPLHTNLRRMLLKVFNPGLAKKAEAATRDVVNGLFDRIDANGGGNLVNEFGLPIPVSVTARLLGIPPEDTEKVAAWFFEILHTDWPAYNVLHRDQPDSPRGITGSAPELSAYLGEQITRRREAATPPDDLLTGLIQADLDGERCSDDRVRALAVNFLSAGLSTTNLIGNLFYRLLSDDGFQQTLRADRELIPKAIEESLRVESPVLFLFRTTAEDTEVGGEVIQAGERVAMGIACANRDETVYDDPDEFRLDRSGTPEHLAFGAGPHLCLGNTMARMEAKVAIEEFFDRYAPGELALAPDYHFELMPHYLEYGPERLDVVVRRGA
jgi:cytochrome P450